GRLAWHIDALAAGIELPAVVHAAQAAFLVATEEEGRPTMRTIRVDNADLTVGISKSDEILAQCAGANRVAVGLRQLVGKQRRKPETPQEFAHWRAPSNTGEQLVLVDGQHAGILRPDSNSDFPQVENLER